MFLEQHIIMISEDHVTEDWSNDAENTALITEINYSSTHITQFYEIVVIFEFDCILNK